MLADARADDEAADSHAGRNVTGCWRKMMRVPVVAAAALPRRQSLRIKRHGSLGPDSGSIVGGDQAGRPAESDDTRLVGGTTLNLHSSTRARHGLSKILSIDPQDDV